MSDVFEENIRKEEKLFLSLCSREDKQKLMQQIPITFHDYLRITCILSNLNLVFYEIRLIELFPEFHKKKEQMLVRHEEILKEYPDYDKDENFNKIVQDWLTEFHSQIPDNCHPHPHET